MSKKYTKEHEWIEITAAGRARIGVTDFAQEQLGDVVMIDPPEVGAQFEAGAECAVIESVKAASDIFCPLAGKVAAINDALADAPELVNTAPESDGWIFELGRFRQSRDRANDERRRIPKIRRRAGVSAR